MYIYFIYLLIYLFIPSAHVPLHSLTVIEAQLCKYCSLID